MTSNKKRIIEITEKVYTGYEQDFDEDENTKENDQEETGPNRKLYSHKIKEGLKEVKDKINKDWFTTLSTSDKIKLDYKFDQAIGQGGYGIVYRAHDKVSKQLVAIKEIRNIS